MENVYGLCHYISAHQVPSFVSPYWPQVRDHLSMKRPSEVQIPLEEVHNPCRLVLRPPRPRGPSIRSVSSTAQHKTKGPLIPVMALLISSLVFIA